MSLFRLYISSVSTEFGSYSSILYHYIDKINVLVKTQKDFYANEFIISNLDNYIQQCETVVHLVGDQFGVPASPSSLEWLQVQYPDFLVRYPALNDVLTGKELVSYTHWEAYLAIYHGKSLMLAVPSPDVVRDHSPIKKPAFSKQKQLNYQADHLARLRNIGYYPEIAFRNADQLAAAILSSVAGNIMTVQDIVKPLNLPYLSLGSLFKGRVIFLHTIREKLVNGNTSLALVGLGGIGKTRLAIEYAWQYRQEYTALLFIRADTLDSLQTSLAALCGALVLNLPEQVALEQEVQVTAVLGWLSRNSGWLLIMDNVNTFDSARAAERLLSQIGDGHVLITTRISQWSRQVERIALDLLSPQDAADFLLERTLGSRLSTTTDEVDALDLASNLGQLALALEQAGAYIEQRHITLQSYLKRWTTNQSAVWAWSDEQLTGYSRSVATAWLASFEQLTVNAQILLNRLAWLSTEPFPLTLLEVSAPNAEPLDAEEALVDLARYSLVNYASDHKSFTIHRLIQEITRTRLSEGAQRQFIGEALAWIDSAFAGEPDNVRSWPVLDQLLPHALAVTAHVTEFENLSPNSRLLNQLGILFNAKAQYRQGEALFCRALAINEASYGPDHPEVATVLNNLAGLLQTTNRLAEAEALFRRALAIDEASYGPDHPEVAIDLNNLALLLRATNCLAEAEALFRRALAINEASYGPDHPEVATVLNNLALLLPTSRLAEAEVLLHRVLSIDQASYGPDHPKVATVLNNLAGLLQTTNRLAEAEALFRRALAIDEASYGPDHPEVAIDLNNLALLLRATNRLAEAEALFRRALAINEASYGPGHPKVATVLNNLAEPLQTTDRLTKAKLLIR